ncbi:MAG: WbqC family protein [Bacteroidales bacterium]
MQFFDTALLSTAYLAPVQYYTKFMVYKKIFIEAEENYQKQSYRNRCNILTANGILPLTIPVSKDMPKIKTRDIRIDNTLEWQKNHWTSIESAYSSSPFFEFYMDEFSVFYTKKYRFLLEFNLNLQDYILDQLEIKPNIFLTKQFIEKGTPDYDDYRDSIHPKKRQQRKDKTFKPEFYYQVFREKFGFVGNLSIIDLLFNEGPNAENILKKSIAPK